MELETILDEITADDHQPPPNESNTCDWVILRILYAIGYEHREIISRLADGAGKFPDYTILPNDNRNLFYLEAKSWSVDLQDDHAIQSLNYANTNGKRWVVLTNGQCWRLYDNRIEGTPEAKLVVQAFAEDREQIVRFLKALSKHSVPSKGLDSFATEEREAKKRAVEQRILAESQNDRRRSLAAFIKKSGNDESSALIVALMDFFRKIEPLAEITASDIVAVLRSLYPEIDTAPDREIAERSPNPSFNTSTPATDRQIWYVNVGEGVHRNWGDNVRYGYLGAGQGRRWSQSLSKLQTGNFCYAYLKGQGYVGFGRVLRPAVMIKDFRIQSDASLLDCPLKSIRANEHLNDPDKAEWAVAIEWIKTFSSSQAKSFRGIFASTHVACQLKNQRETLVFLEKEFAAS